MGAIKQPRKPKLGASQRSWDIYEDRLTKYVNDQNERKRRRELKDKKLSKVKI